MKKFRFVLIISIGLIAISFSSIFIKLCDAPSLIIAAYRLTIASAFYLFFTRIKLGPILPSFSSSQKKIATISGIFLTIHFATWISSLKYTSVASSVVLVQSAPMFVAVGSIIFLKEKPTLKMIIGIFITILGSVIISVNDFSFDKTSIVGNVLAVGGAIGAAGYIIAGRKLRSNLDTFRYVSVVYSIAAFFLLLFAFSSGASFVGYSTQTYVLLVAIALVPQIIGHTAINWALKYFSATTISVIILTEPICASILALFILGEGLGFIKIIGGLIIIVGVLLVLLGEGKRNNLVQSA